MANARLTINSSRGEKSVVYPARVHVQFGEHDPHTRRITAGDPGSGRSESRLSDAGLQRYLGSALAQRAPSDIGRKGVAASRVDKGIDGIFAKRRLQLEDRRTTRGRTTDAVARAAPPVATGER